ncbi:MAG: F0F1 ATP synthase subunit A [Pseudophaeobacter sp. bin_em_oilr2.035]|uniref:ATP synthase subunit a n=1 Tax=Phaeobacter gallaeciensis TaxID=60890 RepID=A0ABD4X6C1_9RHOB|nr:F0F1 ATP synthase subunit A [Phaeobacter gallaeciensis]MDF1771210.1 F0F1 ATP synthase subunit A [Pseudophaeobacter sp. bin_em_oilr2.035]MDE4143860.1 F0F1 ATP synthase subunit A [Phaeobacter gallaeciensis]MDE4155778.1 F0F1 ATP synthase subunit A [Phaeobacter gallaeciensis]MDE4159966.1 F0F1 ATP synthase subunit A [Phaeobacter gallaeciensis]MDE4164940.1 F0F1 ATP synthase subunit A [Phaeobacter gallaeciensis]
MDTSPLLPDILFHVGPVPISRAVVTTWALMLAMAAFLGIALRKPAHDAGPVQAALEVVLLAIVKQLREILGRDPWPFLPLLGSLFLFLCLANLAAVLPGATPPTGHIETPAALALIVFLSVHFYGLKIRGTGPYLRHYLEPSPLLLPLNILSELTRTFSLIIRLFGNMMSHEFVLAIVVFLTGLLVPVPFLLLGILIGIIQAYIFTVLAAVYIAAAVGAVET